MSLPFPRVIDSTMRSAFVSCPQKFYWEFLRAQRPARPNIHLHFGGCFATGIEHTRRAFYAKGADAETARAAGTRALLTAWSDFPVEDGASPLKTLEACVGALDTYFDHWPLDWSGFVPTVLADGSLGVELRLWAESGVTHPDGGPVYWAGRFDALLEDRGGEFNAPGQALPGAYPLYIDDEKTTTRLGPKWGEQFRLRGQFLGYTWLVQQLGLTVHGVLVRGCAPKKTGPDFVEVQLSHQQWQINRWVAQMRRDVERMIDAWRNGVWDWNYGDSCNAYGGCPYLMLCESPTPEDWVASNFVHKPWNPLAETLD